MEKISNEELVMYYEKKIKILEKKLKRSDENRLHAQEMRDKTLIFLTKLKDEIDEANEIIKNRNEELSELKEIAETSAKIKSDFLANMSHEIKTPMNAIIGFTDLLLKTKLDEKQSDYINKIGNAAHNLLHIINDILDFSKIDAEKLTLEKIEFSLEEVMNNLASMLSMKAHKKGLEFLIIKDPKIPDKLQGDPFRLGQILINLSDNAIKFTESGVILVKASIRECKANYVIVFFEVIDMGIGLTKEEQSRLFQPFNQADNSTTRKYGGTGLGLSISKQLVELMDGSINVKSEYGKGSNFFFTAKFNVNIDNTLKGSLNTFSNIYDLTIEQNKNSRSSIELNKLQVSPDKLYEIKTKDIEYKVNILINLLNEGDSRARRIFEEVSIYLKNLLSYEDMKSLTRYISEYNFTEAGEILKKFTENGVVNNDR